VLLGTALGLTLATQVTAAALGYHRALGAPSALFYGLPLYPIWRYVFWYLTWGTNSSAWGHMITAGQYWVFGGIVVGMVGALLCRQASFSGAQESTSHGSGRFATKAEVVHAGLFAGGNSVMLGVAYGKYLRHNGEAHTLVLAPTGEGKTAGVVIPTLLSLTGSAVVFDLKGELWETTAGWGSQQGTCLYMNPCTADGACYNPLHAIRQGVHEIGDVLGLVHVLTNPHGRPDSSNPEAQFWEKGERALMAAAILHVLYAEREKTLAGVDAFLSNPARAFLDTIEVMRTTSHLPDGPHPYVAKAMRDILECSEKVRAGLKQGVSGYLELYREPLLARTTGHSDFALTDLQYGERPVSLYLVVPPGEILRLRPWVRMMLQQITRALTIEGLTSPRRHVDLILDEFPSLQAMPFLTERFAYLRAYQVRALLVAQSLQQLDEAYGPHHSLLDACGMRVMMATYDDKTARRMSTFSGETTVQREQESRGGRHGGLGAHTQRTQVEHKRQLLTTGEVLYLPENELLLFSKANYPIRATKIVYYTDRTWQKRLSPAPSRTPRHDSALPHPWAQEGSKPWVEPASSGHQEGHH
jgi:type IV secretion system protein VirD4